MAKASPESRWQVSREGECIVVVEPDGTRVEANIDELDLIHITTNDTGPVGIDFWWVLEDAGEIILCAFPLGATGDEAVIAWMRDLPGFDMDAMGGAIRSTTNADFIVWKRA